MFLYQSGTAVSKNADAMQKALDAIAADIDEDDDEEVDEAEEELEVVEAVAQLEEVSLRVPSRVVVACLRWGTPFADLVLVLYSASFRTRRSVPRRRRRRERSFLCSLRSLLLLETRSRPW